MKVWTTYFLFNLEVIGSDKCGESQSNVRFASSYNVSMLSRITGLCKICL